MTPIPHLNNNDPIHKEIIDLIAKGLVDYGYNEEGEFVLFLTEAGEKVADAIADQ